MIKAILLATWSFFSALAVGGAHDYVTYPVLIDIRIEPHQIRATIESDGIYWRNEVMGVPMIFSMPATDWPAPFQTAARGYLDRCFQISMDGRPLTAESFHCRHIQEPFNRAGSRVVFTLTYPVAEMGRRLSGRARFFSEMYDQHQRETGPKENHGVFLSRLRVVGPKKVEIALPYEKPDFEILTEGMVMTEIQRSMERFGKSAMIWAASPFFWLALIFGVRWVYKKFFAKGEE